MQVNTSALSPLLNNYATLTFAKSYSKLHVRPFYTACCDLLQEMHNTNTEIIDIGVNLFSMIRFDFIQVFNSFTF